MIRDAIGDFTGSTHWLTIAFVIGLPAAVFVFAAFWRLFRGECTKMISLGAILTILLSVSFVLMMLYVSTGTSFEGRMRSDLALKGMLLGTLLAIFAWFIAWRIMFKRPDHCSAETK